MAAEADKIVNQAVAKAVELRKRGKVPEAEAQLTLAATYARGHRELEKKIQNERKRTS